MMHARMAELIGRLSLAFDIASHSSQGKTVRSVVLAAQLGGLAGASDDQISDTYWLSLLAYLGSTGFVHEEVLIRAADDRSLDSATSTLSIDEASPHVSVMERPQRASCDTSIHLAQIVGAGSRILSALGELCERWDGRGLPARLAGEALAMPVRLLQLAHVTEIAHDRHGRAGAAALVRRRAGGQLDPRLSQVFLDNQDGLFEAVEDPQIFDRFLGLEPTPTTWVDERRMDDIARALAIFTDLKCPMFLGHSTGVAALAERAAGFMGFSTVETRTLRWAALLHDLGRLSVPNGIWMRPGALDWAQWERVRLHAHYSERVLAPIAVLGTVTNVAVAAHERVDGTGYHQHRISRSLLPAARLLAAADVAHAMGEDRPYRPAFAAEGVAHELIAEVRRGRLDAMAVDAVLAALGMETRAEPRSLNGLSDRELDVSRLLARGKTNKDIAHLLGISVRTVHNHVAHIFEKLGVHSRSGAAIWLIEHDLAH